MGTNHALSTKTSNKVRRRKKRKEKRRKRKEGKRERRDHESIPQGGLERKRNDPLKSKDTEIKGSKTRNPLWC